MSVTTVNELWEPRTGDFDESSDKVKRVFHVFTDDIEDGPITVASDTNIPEIYDDHPEDDDLWSVRKSAVVDTDPYTWKVTVNYERKPAWVTSGAGGNNPWDWAPQIAFGRLALTKVLDKAYQKDALLAPAGAPPWSAFTPAAADRGKPLVAVVNSVEQPFDPPATIEEFLTVISIQRHIRFSDMDFTDIDKYQNTINKTAVSIAGVSRLKQTCLCRDYRVSPKQTTPSGVAYVTENIEIVINPDTWVRAIQDAGTLVADNPSGSSLITYTPILDDAGNQINEPVLLDGNRQRLGDGLAGVFLGYHALWEQDWQGWLPETYP